MSVDDATESTILHYGQAGYLNVIRCGLCSYHEWGYIPDGEISKGRVINEKYETEIVNEEGENEVVDSGVKFLYINSTNEGEEEDTVFDEIIIGSANGAEAPAYGRGEVNIASTGTLVIKQEVIEGDSTSTDNITSESYIWLYKQGVVSQMAVVDEVIEGIEAKVETDAQGNTSTKFVATNNNDKVVAIGIEEATPADQKAACELSNIYSGQRVAGTTEVGGTTYNLPELDENKDISIIDGVNTADIASKANLSVEEVIRANEDKKDTIASAIKDIATEQNIEGLKDKEPAEIASAITPATVEDKGTAAAQAKEETKKALEGYVAYNSTTMKYYKDAEEAFNEAAPINDTVILLADVEVLLDNIQNEVNVDLNGHEIKRNYISSKYIQIGQLGRGSSLNYYIYTQDPYNSNYFYSTDTNWYKVNGSTYALWYLFTGSTGWDKVSDKDLYDIVDYYWPQYAKCEISNLDTIDTFVGNTTALKYFAGGYGTEERPFEISTSQHFGNINFLGLERRVYYKLMNDLTAEGYAEDYDYDFDLNGKTLKPLRNAAFWAVDYLRVHNGNVVLTADNGSLFGDDSYTSNVYVEDINLSGNVKVTSRHYGALCKYLGNSEYQLTKEQYESMTAYCHVKNVNSYVNIKGDDVSAGGLFGYCLHAGLDLQNVNVYGSIEAGINAGGIVMGDSQVCGYSKSENAIKNGQTYGIVENVVFNGSIIVPEGKTAYYYGNTRPNSNADNIYKGEEATIIYGINIDNDLIVDDNGEFKINTKQNYSKYVIKFMFSIDSTQGSGGYPRSITKEFDNSTDSTISTGIYKNAILTTDNIEGMTLVSDDYNSIYISDNADGIYYFLTYGSYKLSGNNVTVKVFAYTGDTLKATGTYSYSYNLGE